MDKLQINKLHGDTLGEVGATEEGGHICASYVVISSAMDAIRETFLDFDMKWFIHS